MIEMYKKILSYLGNRTLKYFSDYLNSLKNEINKSNLNILFEMYVGRMVFFCIVAFLAGFLGITLFFSLMIKTSIILSITSGIVGAVTLTVVVLVMFYFYPFQLLSSKKGSIQANMPFVINHMSAIASSGVPPYVIFKLLIDIKEYGEICNEARRIVRNVDVFGMDIISAIRNVAERTPSDDFKQFLFGIVSTIDTGGNIQKYLESSAKDALFDYRLKRQKYLQTLSTYADFYTAVLIAAPLFFISILSIMSLIGGQILGMSIPFAMRVGIYLLIPLLNVIFLLFVHFTQPSM